MSTYYTLLTNLGAALHANAVVMQTTVPWTHMCLGDGGGAPVVPVQTQTALKREVHRLAITDIAQHPDNPNWLIVEAVVPGDVGGWTVRETAIYGGANGAQCIAVGNYPETYKPVLAEGAAREMVMRMVVEISSTATVKLTIDPAVAIASRAWVESLVATPQKRGLVKLATVDESKEGVRPDVAVTPEGLGAALAEVGGLPRFTPYVWGGLAGAIPQGDTQSSGQQLTDLMYPTMRAEVTATQFTCTEAQWQADPYKRVTHWSLGDGASWMRPPDKNGVQPGNVGAFYGVGANPAGGKPGTAVTDAIRNITGTFAGGEASGSPGDGAFKREGASSSQNGNVYPQYFFSFDASRVVPVASENRPKTWYGIWMIRMYGRVTNAGDLNAPALNARMDLIDARVAALEGKDFGVTTQKWFTTTATRLRGVPYVADQTFVLRVEVNVDSTTGASAYADFTVDGEVFKGATVPYGAGALFIGEMLITKGSTFSYQLAGSFNAPTLKVREFRRGA